MTAALSTFNRALTLDPKMAGSLYMRGVVKIRLGKAADGQADITSALVIDPTIAERYKGFGVSP